MLCFALIYLFTYCQWFNYVLLLLFIDSFSSIALAHFSKQCLNIL